MDYGGTLWRMNTYPKESVADRYEARKQAQGWYTPTVQAMPEGTRVQIDGPFGDAHEKLATIVSDHGRQVVLRVDGEDDIRVVSKPAIEVVDTP